MPPTTAEALNAALAEHRAGCLAAAEERYRAILADDPACAAAWDLLGALCLQTGRHAEAVEKLRQAVALDATRAEFFDHLGAAYSALGQHEAAVTSLRRAVQLSPQGPSSHYNLGTALRNAGRLEDAIISFRHAVAADPRAAEAHYNLANTLRELKRLPEAEASYRAALVARPNYQKAMLNLANVLREQERFDEAIALFERTVAIDPKYARGYMNLGTVFRDVGRFDEAVEALRRSVALDPQLAEAHNNLGTALQSRAEFDAALTCYQQALALQPDLPEARFSRGTFRLREGRLAEGFAEYAWRWKCKSYTNRMFDKPHWDGSPLAGRTILLHAEQGLGDTLQFVRYADDVQRLGGRVIFECQESLFQILAGCRGIEQFVVAGQPLPDYDVHCPLLSLPGVLGLSIDELARGAYLAAEPARVETWREKLAPVTGFRIGICWQGNPKHMFDRQRSFPLTSFAPLARLEDVRLVSLQKGPGSEQRAACGFEVFDLGDELDRDGAFLDTAAVIKNLDLVITSDTSLAHLSGVLGAPTWVAISAHSDWRWFIDREDSPWYPTMRLFRQTRLDRWDDVFARIASAVK